MKPLGEMRPINVVPIPGHTIAIDFILGLPVVKKSAFWIVPKNGFNYAISVSGQFDKRTIAIPGRPDWSAET